MPPPEASSIGLGPVRVQVSESTQRGVGNFAMSRTWALVIILCCAIITGGFSYATINHKPIDLSGYATKIEVEKIQSEVFKKLDENQREFRSWASQIDQRLFDLAKDRGGK